MIKHTEVMKLALEALTKNSDRVTEIRAKDQAITALREALTSVPDWAREAKEQPAPATELREQEPVVYAVYHRMGGGKSLHWPEQHSPDGDANEYQLLPLYTSPPAQRTWVGLTDDERLEVAEIDGADEWFWKVCKAIEAKLREKNT